MIHMLDTIKEIPYRELQHKMMPRSEGREQMVNPFIQINLDVL